MTSVAMGTVALMRREALCDSSCLMSTTEIDEHNKVAFSLVPDFTILFLIHLLHSVSSHRLTILLKRTTITIASMKTA